MRGSATSWSDTLRRLPVLVLVLFLFLFVALTHLTLLRLPYYWDEGGYYIPAARDFYHRFTLIPHYTNAHPPLPNVLLGALWHLTGPSILATRLAICAVAATGLAAVFRLAQRLLDSAAVALVLLVAVYPIWFAQSTLAHADIFAAAFTLWAFAMYLPATAHFSPTLDASAADFSRNHKLDFVPLRSSQFLSSRSDAEISVFPRSSQFILIAVLFSLAALSKETAIVEPVTLAALHLARALASRRDPRTRRKNLLWFAWLCAPILPLGVWFAYHHHRTGFTFGNPEYLRYNATANFTASHIAQAFYYRAIHLFWQRNIWLPILLAVACLLLPRRSSTTFMEPSSTLCVPEETRHRTLTPVTLRTITVLLAGNWLAFSVLGGALLTRYLLPVYPLILLVCLDVWRARTRWWPALAALTATAFVSALWLNPPAAFAPEDNLTYRDMVVVHQNAIRYLAEHYPSATVLTAWPVSTDLFNPWLGYVSRPIRADAIENFSLPELQKAAAHPGDFDTALVFATHYVPPALAAWYRSHPTTHAAREYARERDLSPGEIAALLHGTIVFEQHIGGEWAAVIRFKRSYYASESKVTSEYFAFGSEKFFEQ